MPAFTVLHVLSTLFTCLYFSLYIYISYYLKFNVLIFFYPADRQIGTTIKYKLIKLFIDFQKGVFSDCNYFKDLADIPINFHDAIYGSEDETYTVFMTPGMILT